MTEYLKVQETLDRHEVTREALDAVWAELAVTNRVIRAMDAHGKHWSDLPPHLLDDLISRADRR